MCAPVDVERIYQPVYHCRSRLLNAFISLRPVSLPVDDPLIKECVLREKEIQGLDDQDNEIDHIIAKKKELAPIASSNSGQTFTGLINEEPSFLAGIRESRQDLVHSSFRGAEGDYNFYPEFPKRMVTGADPLQPFVAMTKVLLHFFSYRPVTRLIVRINRNDVFEMELLREAGFIFLQESDPPYSLYFHSGRGYLDR